MDKQKGNTREKWFKTNDSLASKSKEPVGKKSKEPAGKKSKEPAGKKPKVPDSEEQKPKKSKRSSSVAEAIPQRTFSLRGGSKMLLSKEEEELIKEYNPQKDVTMAPPPRPAPKREASVQPLTGKRTFRRIVDEDPEEPLIKAVKAAANPDRQNLEEEAKQVLKRRRDADPLPDSDRSDQMKAAISVLKIANRGNQLAVSSSEVADGINSIIKFVSEKKGPQWETDNMDQISQIARTTEKLAADASQMNQVYTPIIEMGDQFQSRQPNVPPLQTQMDNVITAIESLADPNSNPVPGLQIDVSDASIQMAAKYLKDIETVVEDSAELQSNTSYSSYQSIESSLSLKPLKPEKDNREKYKFDDALALAVMLQAKGVFKPISIDIIDLKFDRNDELKIKEAYKKTSRSGLIRNLDRKTFPYNSDEENLLTQLGFLWGILNHNQLRGTRKHFPTLVNAVLDWEVEGGNLAKLRSDTNKVLLGQKEEEKPKADQANTTQPQPEPQPQPASNPPAPSQNPPNIRVMTFKKKSTTTPAPVPVAMTLQQAAPIGKQMANEIVAFRSGQIMEQYKPIQIPQASTMTQDDVKFNRIVSYKEGQKVVTGTMADVMEMYTLNQTEDAANYRVTKFQEQLSKFQSTPWTYDPVVNYQRSPPVLSIDSRQIDKRILNKWSSIEAKAINQSEEQNQKNIAEYNRMKEELKDFLSSAAFQAYRNKDIQDQPSFGAKDLTSSDGMLQGRIMPGVFGFANRFEYSDEIVEWTNAKKINIDELYTQYSKMEELGQKIAEYEFQQEASMPKEFLKTMNLQVEASPIYGYVEQELQELINAAQKSFSHSSSLVDLHKSVRDKSGWYKNDMDLVARQPSAVFMQSFQAESYPKSNYFAKTFLDPIRQSVNEIADILVTPGSLAFFGQRTRDAKNVFQSRRDVLDEMSFTPEVNYITPFIQAGAAFQNAVSNKQKEQLFLLPQIYLSPALRQSMYKDTMEDSGERKAQFLSATWDKKLFVTGKRKAKSVTAAVTQAAEEMEDVVEGPAQDEDKKETGEEQNVSTKSKYRSPYTKLPSLENAWQTVYGPLHSTFLSQLANYQLIDAGFGGTNIERRDIQDERAFHTFLANNGFGNGVLSDYGVSQVYNKIKALHAAKQTRQQKVTHREVQAGMRAQMALELLGTMFPQDEKDMHKHMAYLQTAFSISDLERKNISEVEAQWAANNLFAMAGASQLVENYLLALQGALGEDVVSMTPSARWVDRNKPFVSGGFFTRNREPITPEIETLFGHTKLLGYLHHAIGQISMMGNTQSMGQEDAFSWAFQKQSNMEDLNPTSAFAKKAVPVPGISGRSNTKKKDQTADSQPIFSAEALIQGLLDIESIKNDYQKGVALTASKGTYEYFIDERNKAQTRKKKIIQLEEDIQEHNVHKAAVKAYQNDSKKDREVLESIKHLGKTAYEKGDIKTAEQLDKQYNYTKAQLDKTFVNPGDYQAKYSWLSSMKYDTKLRELGRLKEKEAEWEVVQQAASNELDTSILREGIQEQNDINNQVLLLQQIELNNIREFQEAQINALDKVFRSNENFVQFAGMDLEERKEMMNSIEPLELEADEVARGLNAARQLIADELTYCSICSVDTDPNGKVFQYTMCCGSAMHEGCFVKQAKEGATYSIPGAQYSCPNCGFLPSGLVNHRNKSLAAIRAHQEIEFDPQKESKPWSERVLALQYQQGPNSVSYDLRTYEKFIDAAIQEYGQHFPHRQEPTPTDPASNKPVMFLRVKKGENPDKANREVDLDKLVQVKQLKNHDVLYALGNVIELLGGKDDNGSSLQTISGLYEAHRLGFLVTKGTNLTPEQRASASYKWSGLAEFVNNVEFKHGEIAGIVTGMLKDYTQFLIAGPIEREKLRNYLFYNSLTREGDDLVFPNGEIFDTSIHALPSDFIDISARNARYQQKPALVQQLMPSIQDLGLEGSQAFLQPDEPMDNAEPIEAPPDQVIVQDITANVVPPEGEYIDREMAQQEGVEAVAPEVQSTQVVVQQPLPPVPVVNTPQPNVMKRPIPKFSVPMFADDREEAKGPSRALLNAEKQMFKLWEPGMGEDGASLMDKMIARGQTMGGLESGFSQYQRPTPQQPVTVEQVEQQISQNQEELKEIEEINDQILVSAMEQSVTQIDAAHDRISEQISINTLAAMDNPAGTGQVSINSAFDSQSQEYQRRIQQLNDQVEQLLVKTQQQDNEVLNLQMILRDNGDPATLAQELQAYKSFLQTMKDREGQMESSIQELGNQVQTERSLRERAEVQGIQSLEAYKNATQKEKNNLAIQRVQIDNDIKFLKEKERVLKQQADASEAQLKLREDKLKKKLKEKEEEMLSMKGMTAQQIQDATRNADDKINQKVNKKAALKEKELEQKYGNDLRERDKEIERQEKEINENKLEMQRQATALFQEQLKGETQKREYLEQQETVKRDLVQRISNIAAKVSLQDKRFKNLAEFVNGNEGTFSSQAIQLIVDEFQDTVSKSNQLVNEVNQKLEVYASNPHRGDASKGSSAMHNQWKAFKEFMVTNGIRTSDIQGMLDFQDYIKTTSRAQMGIDQRQIDEIVTKKRAEIETVEAKGQDIKRILARVQERDSVYSNVRDETRDVVDSIRAALQKYSPSSGTHYLDSSKVLTARNPLDVNMEFLKTFLKDEVSTINKQTASFEQQKLEALSMKGYISDRTTLTDKRKEAARQIINALNDIQNAYDGGTFILNTNVDQYTEDQYKNLVDQTKQQLQAIKRFVDPATIAQNTLTNAAGDAQRVVESFNKILYETKGTIENYNLSIIKLENAIVQSGSQSLAIPVPAKINSLVTISQINQVSSHLLTEQAKMQRANQGLRTQINVIDDIAKSLSSINSEAESFVSTMKQKALMAQSSSESSADILKKAGIQFKTLDKMQAALRTAAGNKDPLADQLFSKYGEYLRGIAEQVQDKSDKSKVELQKLKDATEQVNSSLAKLQTVTSHQSTQIEEIQGLFNKYQGLDVYKPQSDITSSSINKTQLDIENAKIVKEIQARQQFIKDTNISLQESKFKLERLKEETKDATKVEKELAEMASKIHEQEMRIKAKKRGQEAIRNYANLMAGEYQHLSAQQRSDLDEIMKASGLQTISDLNNASRSLPEVYRMNMDRYPQNISQFIRSELEQEDKVVKTYVRQFAQIQYMKDKFPQLHGTLGQLETLIRQVNIARNSRLYMLVNTASDYLAVGNDYDQHAGSLVRRQFEEQDSAYKRHSDAISVCKDALTAADRVLSKLTMTAQHITKATALDSEAAKKFLSDSKKVATDIGVMFQTLESRVKDMQMAFNDPFHDSVQGSLVGLKLGAFEQEFNAIDNYIKSINSRDIQVKARDQFAQLATNLVDKYKLANIPRDQRDTFIAKLKDETAINQMAAEFSNILFKNWRRIMDPIRDQSNQDSQELISAIQESQIGDAIGNVQDAKETMIGIFRHFKSATQKRLVEMAASSGLANAKKLLESYDPDSIEMLLRQDYDNLGRNIQLSTQEFKARQRYLNKKVQEHIETVSAWSSAVKYVKGNLDFYINHQIAASNEVAFEGAQPRVISVTEERKATKERVNVAAGSLYGIGPVIRGVGRSGKSIMDEAFEIQTVVQNKQKINELKSEGETRQLIAQFQNWKDQTVKGQQELTELFNGRMDQEQFDTLLREMQYASIQMLGTVDGKDHQLQKDLFKYMDQGPIKGTQPWALRFYTHVLLNAQNIAQLVFTPIEAVVQTGEMIPTQRINQAYVYQRMVSEALEHVGDLVDGLNGRRDFGERNFQDLRGIRTNAKKYLEEDVGLSKSQAKEIDDLFASHSGRAKLLGLLTFSNDQMTRYGQQNEVILENNLQQIDELIGYTENRALIKRDNMEYNNKMDEMANGVLSKVKNKAQTQSLIDIMKPEDRKQAEEAYAKAGQAMFPRIFHGGSVQARFQIPDPQNAAQDQRPYMAFIGSQAANPAAVAQQQQQYQQPLLGQGGMHAQFQQQQQYQVQQQPQQQQQQQQQQQPQQQQQQQQQGQSQGRGKRFDTNVFSAAGSLGKFSKDDINLLKYTRFDTQRRRYLRRNQDGTDRQLTSEEALRLFKIILKFAILAYTFVFSELSKDQQEEGKEKLKETLTQNKSRPEKIIDTINKLAGEAVRKRDAKRQRKEKDDYEDED